MSFKELEESIRYLASNEAMQSLKVNTYWPKWNSPWWHITLLWEMGQGHLIPKQAINLLLQEVKLHCLPHFFTADFPPGAEPFLDGNCHCGLGTIYQILSSHDIDVDRELPWIRPWFFKYQMPDGGLNCDDAAYHHADQPSSMVGTIGPLEAVLLCTKRPFTKEEQQFLDKGTECILKRGLMRGSHDEEREDEADWLKPCFPRFYFYDVLRGLSYVLKYAEIRKKLIPLQSIAPALEHLRREFADGKIRTRRLSYEGIGTYAMSAAGEWLRRQHATRFPLLEKVSAVDQVSPYLTASWNEALNRLERLREQKLLID